MTTVFVHLVEDDDAVRDSLAFLLRAARYSVQVFSSAYEYLAFSDLERPDCIITDLRMPGTGGLELVRLIRERGSQVPVLVITGDGDEEVSEAAREAGAHGVVYKPFSDEGILTAVQAAVASSPATGSSSAT